MPPFIVTPPAGRRAGIGARVDFSAVLGGSIPLAYQWLFNGTNSIPGATDAVLHLVNVQPAQAGRYSVAATNAFGSVTSPPALLKVDALVVTNPTEANLRAALAEAGKVVIACEGAITLADTITVTNDTVLDATGHHVTISGNQAVRVFYVGTNVSFTLKHVMIADGQSTNGAGIYNDGGAVVVENCTFSANSVRGCQGSPPGAGADGDGMAGCGGAIYSGGSLEVSQCSFLQNSASGGEGGWAWSPGSAGGAGQGGAIFSAGALAVSASLFAYNTASGGPGGVGTGGFILVPIIPPAGGPGGPGGDGLGGAIFNGGTASLVNCTVADNTGTGGSGGWGGVWTFEDINPISGPPGPNGPAGYGWGGICSINGQLYLTNCTVAFNTGGIQCDGGLFVNTLLATNLPQNVSASAATDGGHNLSSDGSWSLSTGTSRNNTDAKLGPLADNGGPTLTCALLPGSPAINAGDSASAPPVDQRGFPRPLGNSANIGAFEYGVLSLTISNSAPAGLAIWVSGAAGPFCCLLRSGDLRSWTPVATNQVAADGTAQFRQGKNPGPPGGFFRVTVPGP